MKKHLVSLFVIFGCTFGINPAIAVIRDPIELDACASCGATVGASCGGPLNTDTPVSGLECVMDMACTNGVNCKYVSCNGKCICANSSYVCQTEGGDIIINDNKCSDTPMWTSAVAGSGLQTGTCKISGVTTTIYRCDDGYYSSGASSVGASTNGYSTSRLTCTLCPKHPDDVSSSDPTYVTTGGDGVADFITECKVKANSEIQGSVGKFVFENACSYSLL